MLTFVVAAQKGGSGKTTIALHLAVAASVTRSTIVVDTDPQRSAAGWARIRGGKPPEVYEAAPSAVPAVLAAAQGDGIEIVVIDTPPHSTAEASRMLAAADVIIVPVRPTVLDLMALEATQRIVQAAARPAVAILSAVPARGPEADEAEHVLRGPSRAATPSLNFHGRLMRAVRFRACGCGCMIAWFQATVIEWWSDEHHEGEPERFSFLDTSASSTGRTREEGGDHRRDTPPHARPMATCERARDRRPHIHSGASGRRHFASSC